jgi:uncharacterized membrane protein
MVSGFTIVNFIIKKGKDLATKIFLAVSVPMLFLVLIYPYFSVRSYFNSLKTYQGLNGLVWLEDKYPDDMAAINWLNINIPDGKQPTILEAAGDSYTDYERISAFTGLPTVAGWAVHEWLWRGGYEPIGDRGGEVQYIYESPDIIETEVLLKKYKVEYLVVGELERQKYINLNEEKITQLGKPVFSQGTTIIYRIGDY